MHKGPGRSSIETICTMSSSLKEVNNCYVVIARDGEKCRSHLSRI